MVALVEALARVAVARPRLKPRSPHLPSQLERAVVDLLREMIRDHRMSNRTRKWFFRAIAGIETGAHLAGPRQNPIRPNLRSRRVTMEMETVP